MSLTPQEEAKIRELSTSTIYGPDELVSIARQILALADRPAKNQDALTAVIEPSFALPVRWEERTGIVYDSNFEQIAQSRYYGDYIADCINSANEQVNLAKRDMGTNLRAILAGCSDLQCIFFRKKQGTNGGCVCRKRLEQFISDLVPETGR